MEESRAKKSIVNIIWGIIRQIVVFVLAFSTRTIFIRLLGAEYAGVGGLYSNILTVLSLTELGISNVFLFGLYKPLKENKVEEIKGLILFYKKIYRIIIMVLCCLGVALVPLLKYILNSTLPVNELILYYLLYLANSVCSYVMVYKSMLLQADQKLYIKNIVHTICIVLQYVLQIVVLLIARNYFIYLLIQVICTLLLNIIMNIIANRQYPFLNDRSIKADFIDKKFITKNVKAMMMYKISNVLVNNTDNILISVLLGTAIVGYYSNYFAILTYLNLFINILVTGINASLGNLNTEEDAERSFKVFNRLLLLFNGTAGLFACCYLNAIQLFIPIWIGKEYLLDNSFVWALLFYFYITTVESPIWMFRETMGLYNEVKWIMLTAAILNIIFSVIFGLVIGLSGILLATSLSRLIVVSINEPHILYKKFREPVKNYYKKQSFYFVVNILILLLSVEIGCIIEKFIISSVLLILCKLIICVSIFGTIYLIIFRKTDEFQWLIKIILKNRRS